jgi:putative flippase GtrA
MQKSLPELIQKLFSNKVIRYLFSGGFSALVDIVIFNLCYNIWFHKSTVNLWGIKLEGYSLALVISYISGSFTSFFLNKFFVFEAGDQGWRQFMKSLPVYFLAFLGNWVLLKGGIQWIHLDPLISRIIAALLVAFITFNLHKYFTFKPKV